jgi:hypothetical protein
MSANNLSLAGLVSDRSTVKSARSIDGLDRAQFLGDELDPAGTGAPQAPLYPEIDVDVEHLQCVSSFRFFFV